MKRDATRLYPKIHFECNCCIDAQGNHRPFTSLKELIEHYQVEHQRIR